YDGSTLIGYGASSSATLNKPISLGQGSHTIKAAFNGMTLSQNFTLSSGETKILTFSFTRTSYDIYKWLNNFNISIYGDILDKSPGRYYCEWAWMPRPITIPADWILFNDYQVEKEILNADPGDQDRGFIHNNGGYLRGVNPPWDDFGGPVQIHFNVNIPVGLEGIMVKGIVYFSYSLINGVVTITHHIEINGYHVYSPYELLPDSISDRVYNQTLQTIYSNSIDYPWLNLHPTWYCQNVNPSGNYFGYTNLFTNVPGYFCYIVTNPPLNLFYNVVEDTQVSTFNIIRTPPPGIVFSTVPYDLLGTGIKG
ncbi:MAG: hypothetical protein NTU54_04275, partial [Candidatus Omnitrophica bacterium]|nr:hypothetical protein [Candidatus Omnitrophota bacterium]